MSSNINSNNNLEMKKKAIAILECYGIEQINKNFSIQLDDEEITAWAIEGLEKEDIISHNLTDEELVELYLMAF